MSTYRRIYKKTLKEPDELATTSNVLNYLRRNSKPIIFMTLIFLISVSSWAGFMVYRGKLNEKVNKEIYYILKESANIKEIPHEKIDNMRKLQGKFISKNAYLNLYLGHFYYKNAKYEDALREYKKVLESKSSPLIKEIALTGAGYSYEALGKYKDAIDAFQNIINEKDNNLANKEEIYLSLGRFYEVSGNYKSAAEKYQLVIDKFPYVWNIENIKEKVKKFKTINVS